MIADGALSNSKPEVILDCMLWQVCQVATYIIKMVLS